MSQTMERARTLLSGFTVGQRSVVLVGVLALLLGAVALTRWIAQPTWTPLYANLSGADANAVVNELRSANVQYQLTNGGSTILVPQAVVYSERIALAGKGLPSGDGTSGGGWSLVDKQGVTATDFQQNVAYQRALEGELAKTLGALAGVRTAVVHLAIPKKDVFSTEADKPTASVLLALQAGTTLDQGQVRAVTRLVAGSVPSLSPGSVTVTDANGSLLSSPNEGADAASAAAGESDQQTAQYENRIGTAVQQMLDRVLGAGKSVVRVNAQLDFSSHDTTSERYVSQTGVPPLSEAEVTESYAGAGNGAGGALGQPLPSLAPGVAASGNGFYARNQLTRDNAVGKIVDRTQAAPGAVQRLTVAVALDAKATSSVPPSQVQALVSNAVGLNAARGDQVQVTALPFDTTAAAAAKAELSTARKAATTAQYVELGKKAGLGLVAVILLVIVLRRRKSSATVIDATASDLPRGEQFILSAPEPLAIEAGEQAAEPLPRVATELEADVSRERMRDEVAALVDNQTDDVAALLQTWLTEGRN
jgi:flagellar M-ring protein FliF